MDVASSLPWAEVIAVGIRTTAAGPFAEDLFWLFLLDDRMLELPGAVVDRAAFDDVCAHLPGVDFEKVTRAMCSTSERVFRIWHREESRFAPDRAELATRFAALVARAGGRAEVAGEVFGGVHTAWSESARRYHSIEHLIDCLRELDRARPVSPMAEVVELALWYHDVVYDPCARDCEERSARRWLADAERLGISQVTACAAAELVRATALASASAASSPAADLVLDIDLSILGRDPLRFLDYEHGIEEEYAAVRRARFRRARRHLLGQLLARPYIFRTAFFRARYEQRARVQIESLLASPRYRRRWLAR